MNESKNETKNKSTMRKLEELNLVDDFLFSRVMANEEVCRLLLEKILNVKISKLVQLEEEKSINLYQGNRGVRFDVYVKDDANTIYEVGQ